MMEGKIHYQDDDLKLQTIELRLIQIDRGWAVEINHQQPAPDADIVFILKLSATKVFYY